MFKNIVILCGLLLVAAGCSPIGQAPTGSGVAKSSNGGVDWVFSNAAVVTQVAGKKKAEVKPSVLATSNVLVLRFDPRNSAVVYAGTQNNGLLVSRDGAVSWAGILNNFSVYDVAIDRADGNKLYVAGQSANTARVLTSSDGGKVWQELYNDASNQNIARGLAFKPGSSQYLVVGTNSGNLVSSQDGGKSWSLVQNFQDPVSHMTWAEDGQLYVLTRGKGLFVSNDGGKTVKNISAKLFSQDAWPKAVSGFIGQDKISTGQVGVPTGQTNAFYKLAVSGNRIFVSANNGLFATSDVGVTWQYLELPLRSSQSTEVRGLAVTGTEIFAAVGNTVFKTSNNGASWQVGTIASSAVINYILVDPQANNLIFIGFIPLQ